MQQMQTTFNLHMEPIKTHEDYPKYARSETKPVVRARHIVDQGDISDHPCTACVELEQDCYRWEGTFSKCAYCTSKDKKREFCHLPGQEASSVPERRKRRKIMGNIYAPGGEAASTADTMMSGTLVTGALASGTTPFPGNPMSGTRSVRGGAAPSLDPASAVTGKSDTRVQPPAAAEAGSEATLERVTALENQVSGLEAKAMGLLVRLEELTSCVSASSTPRLQAAAGASPTTGSVTFGDLQARHLADAPPPPVNVATAAHLATREWVEGPKTPELPDASSAMQVAIRERVEERKTPPMPEHTIEHPEGYRPVNCSCTMLWSPEVDAVMPREANAGADANAFPVDGIASRGNLF
ncbi:hypothetical protein HO133_008543 [Letharia lupina]|uniref:Uncharacterized protein n=1 Tax=Letharia lupina TaxID=560253 RepID=A0A8H6CP58_9LECA|nr:uncharacterized protein HO133_008543 [Letharia lupina]KAF6227102.1 hypothetical protein HO133_008543 [Letharia lupina]